MYYASEIALGAKIFTGSFKNCSGVTVLMKRGRTMIQKPAHKWTE
jgi:hypothetical protein